MDISRHSSYFNPIKSGVPVTIIGAGATGSRVFEACVNLGLTDITVYDYDKVEEHNLANQLFRKQDVGEAKVRGLEYWAAEKLISSHKEQLPDTMIFDDMKIEGNMKDKMRGIVFLLTDSMESRKEIGDNSLKLNNNVLAVIETRMAISHGNILCFDPKNLSEYNKWRNTLIDDKDAETSACGTSLTIGTTASMIANLAVNHMMSYIMNPDVLPDPVTDVFFNPLMLNTEAWS